MRSSACERAADAISSGRLATTTHFEEEILRRAIEDLCAVAHVRVDHLVSCVGPGDRYIAASQRVLEANGIVGWSKGHEDLDVRAKTRIRLPAITIRYPATRNLRAGP